MDTFEEREGVCSRYSEYIPYLSSCRPSLRSVSCGIQKVAVSDDKLLPKKMVPSE